MLARILIAICAVLGKAEASPRGHGWPEPPFVAQVEPATVNVRHSPESAAPIIGELIRGDRIRVTACAPACDEVGAWAVLGEDGAVRLSLLHEVNSSQPGHAIEGFIYGRVRVGGASVFERQDDRSRVKEHVRAGHDLAFKPNDLQFRSGWLERPMGGFVRSDRIRIAKPSTFTGIWRPEIPFRFEQGQVVYGRRRPASIPFAAKWIHVDLSEQVLTAYEGEELVFATLVSTGRLAKATPAGLFRVFAKFVSSAMHGPPEDPYFVDEVPHVLFFKDGMALHGTFWHDHFGHRASHGCINLSMADAKLLFAWAPPKLPDGWHAIYPDAEGRDSLWVFVETQIPISKRFPAAKSLQPSGPVSQSFPSR